MRILFLRIVFAFTYEKAMYNIHKAASLLKEDFTGNYLLIYDSTKWLRQKSVLDFKNKAVYNYNIRCITTGGKEFKV